MHEIESRRHPSPFRNPPRPAIGKARPSYILGPASPSFSFPRFPMLRGSLDIFPGNYFSWKTEGWIVVRRGGAHSRELACPDKLQLLQVIYLVISPGCTAVGPLFALSCSACLSPERVRDFMSALSPVEAESQGGRCCFVGFCDESRPLSGEAALTLTQAAESGGKMTFPGAHVPPRPMRSARPRCRHRQALVWNLFFCSPDPRVIPTRGFDAFVKTSCGRPP